MYLGEIPTWVDAASRDHVRVASDRRRLTVMRRVVTRFPNTTFFGRAYHGDALLDGLCRALVKRVDAARRPNDDLMAQVDQAFADWVGDCGSAPLRDLHEYERLIGEGSPPNDEALKAQSTAAGVRDVVAVWSFGHDMLEFAALVEFLRSSLAPDGVVRQYRPAASEARQVLALLDVDGKKRLLDVTRRLTMRTAS
jgi:hypothetical protein